MQNNKNNMKPITIFSRHSAPLKRLLLSLALIVCCADAAWGESYYVFKNKTDSYGYLYNNDGSLGTSTTFMKASIWIASDNQMSNTNTSTLRSYTNEAKYLQVTSKDGGDASLGSSSQDCWYIAPSYDNTLVTKSGITNYYFSKH